MNLISAIYQAEIFDEGINRLKIKSQHNGNNRDGDG